MIEAALPRSELVSQDSRAQEPLSFRRGHSGVSHKNCGFKRALAYRSLPKTKPKCRNRAGNGDNCERKRRHQIGTLGISKGQTTAATTAAIATPSKIPKARFGCLPPGHVSTNRGTAENRYLQHVAMIEEI